MGTRRRPFLAIVIILGLMLSGCTDQPPPRPPAPTKTVPPPSTPGTTTPTSSDNFEAGTPIAVPSQPVLTPTSGRPPTPPPLFSGKLPGNLNGSLNLGDDPTSAREVARFTNSAKNEKGLPEAFRAAAYSPDGKWLALADRYQIWVVDATNGKLLQNLFASNANSDDWGAHSLAWSPDGLLLGAGGLNGITTMWRWDKGTGNFRKGPARLAASQADETFGDTVEVAFSPDSTRLAAFGSDGHLNIFSTLTNQLQISFLSDFAGYMSWSPDGKRLSDEFLLLHYLDGAQTVEPEDAASVSSDGPQGVAWSPDGKTIAVSGDGFALTLIEPPLPGSPDQPYPAARLLIKRVDLPVSSSGAKSLPHLKEGRRVAWSPSSRWVAVANLPEVGKVSIWDNTGKAVLTFEASPDLIRSLVWSQDALILTAGNDGTARVWQLLN